MYFWFRIEDFYAGPSEGFEPYYGVGGVEGDGDVFKPDNIRELKRFVLENTDNKGEITLKRNFFLDFFCSTQCCGSGSGRIRTFFPDPIKTSVSGFGRTNINA